jgi:thymidylate synthase
MAFEFRAPIIGESFADVYSTILKWIYRHPEFEASPRGQLTREITDLTVIIEDPYQNLFENKARSPNKRYLAGELLWYFLGRNDLEWISQYSKFWNKIANKDGTVNSAYGNLLFRESPAEYISCEWQWAVGSLIKDQTTRQALIHFNKPHHMDYEKTKDFPCTAYGIFQIRNEKLNFKVHMRSNDVYFGMTYDYPFFLLLMQMMRIELLSKYPSLKLGRFTHHIDSAHIYERNFETIEKMLDNEFVSISLPEMRTRLVDQTGRPCRELIDIEQDISEGLLDTFDGLFFDDELINWMYQYAKPIMV